MRYRLKRTQPTKLRQNLQRLMVNHQIRSGSDLARQLGIPAPSVNRILSGQVTDPRISTIILLANYFDTSVDQLLGRQKLF